MNQHTLPFARSPHPIVTHRSAQAAAAASVNRGSKTNRYLELVEHAGPAGVTDYEAMKALGCPMSSVCSIRNGIRNLLWPSDRNVLSPYGKSITAWRRATEDEVAANRLREAQQQELA